VRGNLPPLLAASRPVQKQLPQSGTMGVGVCCKESKTLFLALNYIPTLCSCEILKDFVSEIQFRI
jgi:hypothetical protein